MNRFMTISLKAFLEAQKNYKLSRLSEGGIVWAYVTYDYEVVNWYFDDGIPRCLNKVKL